VGEKGGRFDAILGENMSFDDITNPGSCLIHNRKKQLNVTNSGISVLFGWEFQLELLVFRFWVVYILI
jgi:hypothetical protein